MRRVSSRQNPLVRKFRELAASPDPAGARLLLDGVHLVREAHGLVDLEVAAVAAARLEEDTEAGMLAVALERDGVDVISADASVFGALSPVSTPSGIVAIARRRPVAPADICRTRDAFILLTVDVQDPGNLGALLRVAEAGGVTGALVCGESANPFGWKALRGSMGSALRLPVAAGLTVESALACLAGGGVRAVAAVPRGGDSLERATWSTPMALVLGGEGRGLDEHILRRCAARVTIPMKPPVESLNVAAAGAILVYAARGYRP